MASELGDSLHSKAILDIREFLEPTTIKSVLKNVEARLMGGRIKDDRIFGYTVIDSLHAILSLGEKEFNMLYGDDARRVLVFTKVSMGRSPMIAVKVTRQKPSLIIFHGLEPKDLDPLAVKIANVENIPIAVSRIKEEKELVDKLRQIY